MPSLKNQCKFCCGRVICCRIKQPHLHALINGAEFTAKIHQDPACQIYSEGEEEKISCIDDIDELDKKSSCCKRQKEPKHEKREKKKKKETKEAESQPKESKQKPKDKSPSESSKFPYKPSEEAEIKFPIVECKSSKKSRGKSPCRRKKKEKKSKSPSKKSKSKSPSKKSKSKSPSKKSKSKSPSRKSKSKSPSSKKRKKKSKSPRKKKSKSPSEKKSKSPSEEKCISPSEKKSKPPREKKSKPPREKKSKSPCEKKSKSPSKEKSKSPRKEKSRTREKAKSPSKTRSKSKHKSKSIFQRCRSKCSKSRKTDEVCESIHTAEGDSTMIKPYEGKIIQDVRGRWCCLLIDDLKKLIKESQKDKSNISCPTQNEYDAESEHLKNELKKLLQRNMQDAVLSHETLSSKCKFKTSEENPEKDRWSLYFEDDISTINSKRQKGHIRKRCYSFRESKILDLFCPNRRKNLANKNACEQSKGNEKRKHKKKRKDRTTEIARDVIEEIFEDVLQNMCGQAMYKKSEDTYKDTCLDYSKNSSYTSAITSPKTEIKKPVEERRSVDIYCPESDKVSKKSLSKQSEHSCSDYSEDSLTSKTTTTTKDHPKNVRKQEKRMMAEERIIIRPMQKKMKTENSICEPKIIKKKIEKIKENDKKGATVTIRKLDYKECKYSEETFRDSNCDYTEISSVNTSVTKDNEVVSEKSMTTTKRISGPFPSSYREKKMKAKKPVGKPKAIFKKKEKIKGEKKKVKEKKKRKDKESAKTKKPEKKTSKRTIFKRGLSDKRKVHFNDLNEHKMPETNEIIDVLTCSVNVNEETPNEKLTKESEKEGEEFRNLRNSEDHSNAQTKPEICEKPKRRKIYNVFCASRRKNLRKTKKSNTNKRKEKIKRKDKITKKQRVTKTATKSIVLLNKETDETLPNNRKQKKRKEISKDTYYSTPESTYPKGQIVKLHKNKKEVKESKSVCSLSHYRDISHGKVSIKSEIKCKKVTKFKYSEDGSSENISTKPERSEKAKRSILYKIFHPTRKKNLKRNEIPSCEYPKEKIKRIKDKTTTKQQNIETTGKCKLNEDSTLSNKRKQKKGKEISKDTCLDYSTPESNYPDGQIVKLNKNKKEVKESKSVYSLSHSRKRKEEILEERQQKDVEVNKIICKQSKALQYERNYFDYSGEDSLLARIVQKDGIKKATISREGRIFEIFGPPREKNFIIREPIYESKTKLKRKDKLKGKTEEKEVNKVPTHEIIDISKLKEEIIKELKGNLCKCKQTHESCKDTFFTADAEATASTHLKMKWMTPKKLMMPEEYRKNQSILSSRKQNLINGKERIKEKKTRKDETAKKTESREKIIQNPSHKIKIKLIENETIEGKGKEEKEGRFERKTEKKETRKSKHNKKEIKTERRNRFRRTPKIKDTRKLKNKNHPELTGKTSKDTYFHKTANGLWTATTVTNENFIKSKTRTMFKGRKKLFDLLSRNRKRKEELSGQPNMYQNPFNLLTTSKLSTHSLTIPNKSSLALIIPKKHDTKPKKPVRMVPKEWRKSLDLLSRYRKRKEEMSCQNDKYRNLSPLLTISKLSTHSLAIPKKSSLALVIPKKHDTKPKSRKMPKERTKLFDLLSHYRKRKEEICGQSDMNNKPSPLLITSKLSTHSLTIPKKSSVALIIPKNHVTKPKTHQMSKEEISVQLNKYRKPFLAEATSKLLSLALSISKQPSHILAVSETQVTKDEEELKKRISQERILELLPRFRKLKEEISANRHEQDPLPTTSNKKPNELKISKQKVIQLSPKQSKETSEHSTYSEDSLSTGAITVSKDDVPKPKVRVVPKESYLELLSHSRQILKELKEASRSAAAAPTEHKDHNKKQKKGVILKNRGILYLYSLLKKLRSRSEETEPGRKPVRVKRPLPPPKTYKYIIEKKKLRYKQQEKLSEKKQINTEEKIKRETSPLSRPTSLNIRKGKLKTTQKAVSKSPNKLKEKVKINDNKAKTRHMIIGDPEVQKRYRKKLLTHNVHFVHSV